MSNVSLGEFALVASPFAANDAWTRYTITHVPTGYVKMDQAIAHTDGAELLRSIVESVAKTDPRENLRAFPKSVQKAFPVMIAKEVAVWEAAKAALAS